MQGRGSVAVALAVLVCIVAGDNSRCEYDTCSKCISDASCIWCSNPNITSVAVKTGVTLPQCINKESPNIDKFKEACKDAIYDLPTEVEKEQPSPETLFSPQRVKLKMRAGESINISFNYEHRVNYPMDLYCLMDGSTSMSEFKTLLSSVTKELVAGLMDITQNVQLGFGMFVDKPTLPYTDMNSVAACRECQVDTYSFKNILPLTPDQTAFEEKVLSSPVSTNTDQPEGILEALMQVASCGSEVGWRPDALKVAVVFTDAAFHSAGHGRLAGIVQPNDRTCHLNGKGEYTHSLLQDYPSVGELSKVLKDNNLTTVFAATEDQVSLYQMLSGMLHSSSCSDMDTSSNIVKIIVDPVKDRIQTITLEPQTSMPGLTVDVYTRCKGGAVQKGNTCKEMLMGEKAEFTLDVKIEECPARDQQNVTLNFELVGHSQNLYLDLEMLCECRCEEGKDFIANADICMKQGDLRCGACECHPGFLGKNCQCREGDLNNPDIDETNCINPNATEAVVCSGQGKCECGQCVCNKRPDPDEVIEGFYCQCTNFHKDCRGNNGEICSGHGHCDCNECDCDAGWEGQNCSCSTDTENCKDTEGVVCSGHGNCICNRCECQADYEGKHCENCKFCDEKCEEYKPCVECLVFQTGTYGAACEDQCSSYMVTIISDMTKNYGHLCSSTDEEGCRFFYQVKENGTVKHVWAQDKKECPKVINPWIVVGGVLAGVVLVGLLLLIAWKVVTTIKDKREYEAFKTEKAKAAWTDNVSPLYRPAITDFQNPMFGASN